MGSLAPSAESSSTVQTTGSMTPSESSPEIEISTTTTAAAADREICGICLGPCKGHHSRLTPCNHAICPPCLEKAQQQSSKQSHLDSSMKSADDTSDNQSALTFPCLLCRTQVELSAEGKSLTKVDMAVTFLSPYCRPHDLSSSILDHPPLLPHLN